MLVSNAIIQDRYQIVRQLGQGGMGAVYEAVDKRLDKIVAIKEIILDETSGVTDEQRDLVNKAFRREAQSLVQARHAVVPDVTDYFSELGKSFLVMEYIEGDDLSVMLKKQKEPFEFEAILPWINQLLVALNYLHHLSPPIIHRDIKPQNLKVNEWGKIKLLDFGIAKSTDNNSTVTQNTFVGATMNFSPIEQVLRVIDVTFREFILLNHRDQAEKVLAQSTDSRSDIFALGATVYTLLTKSQPVDVAGRALQLWEGKTDPLTYPSELNPKIPGQVSNWIMQAMEFDRDNRFSSAIEMQNSLGVAVKDHNLELKEQSLAQEESTYVGKSQEEILMSARTEPLINVFENPETAKFVNPASAPQPPDTVIEPMTVDTFPPETSATTDFGTLSPNSGTDQYATRQSHYDQEFVKSSSDTAQNLSAKTPLLDDYNESKSRKYLFAIPIIGILLLAVLGGGIFGIYSVINPATGHSTNAPTESNTAPNIKETTQGGISSEAELSAETNSNENSAVDSNTANVSTTAAAAPTRQPAAPPAASQPARQPSTPPARTKTPTPRTPARPAQNPDCVLTNSCQ